MRGSRWWGVGVAALLPLLALPRSAAAQRPGPGGLVDTRAPIVVALLPFEVNGPADIGYLSEAIPDVLATRLSTLTPAEEGAVQAALRRHGGGPITEAVAREVGREAGAQFVVMGSFTAIGDQLSLDAKILPVTSGRSATVYVQGEGFADLLMHIGSLALEIDKGISGVSAFLAPEPERPAWMAPPVAPGARPRGARVVPLEPWHVYREQAF